MSTPKFAPAPVDIIVGIDGSDNSDRALDVALSIAKQHGCSLRLIGAFTAPVVPDRHAQKISYDYRSTVGREAQDRLDTYARRAKKAGVDVTAQAVEGDAGGVLIEASQDAQLAVVGKRGRNQLASRLLGTVSGRLSAHSHCSVLVVPPASSTRTDDDAVDEHVGNPASTSKRADLSFDRQVVAGIDLGSSGVSVAKEAARAAELGGYDLILVSAVSEDMSPLAPAYQAVRESVRTAYSEHLDAVKGTITRHYPKLTIRTELMEGTAAAVLTEASVTAPVIVVGTRGRGGFTSLLLGSVSRSLLNKAQSPVLVVPTT